MARRGQLVGDAYVRIHADSSAMDKELRREFNARKSGRANGDEWAKGFSESVEEGTKEKLERSRQSLINAAVGGKDEWDRQFKKSGLASVDDFVKSVENRFQKLAGKKNLVNVESIRDALADLHQFADDKKVQQALEAQQKLGERMAKDFEASLRKQRSDQEALGKAIINDWKDAERAQTDYFNKTKRSQEALGNAIIRDWKDAEKAQTDYFNKTKRDQMTLGNSIVKDMEKAEKAAAAFRVTMSKIWFEDFKKQEKAIRDQDIAFQSYSENIGKKLPGAFSRLRNVLDHDRAMERYAKRVDGVIPNALRRMDKKLQGSGGAFERFAHIIGKVFGKGSRNDFLNFIGSVVGGLATIGTKIAHAGTRFLTFGGVLGDVLVRGLAETGKGLFDLATGKGFSGIQDALKNMGQGFGDLGVSIGTTLVSALKVAVPGMLALAAAGAAISVVLFPLLALIANLAGALFVLASQVLVGLLGVALALAPALLAVAGGFGVIVLAVARLNKQTTGKAAKELNRFKDAWSGLIKTFDKGPAVELAKALGNLTPLIKKVLTPMVVGFSRALALITNMFAALFTGPRIQPALVALIKTLPVILANFGIGLGEFIAGLTNFLKPILPFAVRLSEKFRELMSDFDDWTASAEGQNSIKKFMDDAWAAASDLWDIIKLAAEALGGLVLSATGADKADDGKTVLDSIKDNLQKFVDWINGEGKTSIHDFFTQALSTTSQLGDSIAEISDALAQVDWKQATSEANDFVDLMGQLSSFGILFFASFGTQSNAAIAIFKVFGDTIRSVYNAVIGPVLSTILLGVADIMLGISNLLHTLAKVPGFGFLDSIADDLDTATAKVIELSGQIREIPDGSANINVTASGEGLRLLRAAGSNTIAQRRAKVIFGAAGGILSGPTFVRDNVVGGEAGREALVPLDRPLALVDKSVRALSAFAQGLPVSKGASGGILGGGNVNIAPGGVVISVPNSDPVLVAESVIDHLAAGIHI